MRRRIATLLALVSLCVSVSAHANVPSVSNSTVPNCLVFCPKGDLSFDVVVRDIGNSPIAGSIVVLSFEECLSWAHCVQAGPYIYDEPTMTVRAITNASGAISFALQMGGTCPGSHVKVYADGVLLASRSLASPDRDANLEVRGNDVAAINTLIGSTDPTADFDCSGLVDAADVAIANAHIGHACSGVVPVHPSTWGVLKQHYR